MNMPTNQADLVDFPIHELEQIELTIVASQNYLQALQERCEALTLELERITRPRTSNVKAALAKFGPGYLYRGELTRRWKSIDIYLDVLRRLWTDFPEKREAIACAVSTKGRTRAYLARTATQLFPGRALAWTQLHSRLLAYGWYVDTNLSCNQMSGLLPVAVVAAGLKWGEDVKAYWGSAEVQIERVDGLNHGGVLLRNARGLCQSDRRRSSDPSRQSA